MPRMHPELGALYNDHMNQAHTGEARYTAQERHARVRSLLDRGLLREGIDLYHAGLIIADGGGPNTLREAYDLFMQAAERGYPGARAHAALKYDLWLRSQGQPQRFGSFWRWEGDEPMPEPFADPDAVPALRAEWGLPTLAEEAQRRRELRERRRNPTRRGGGGV